MTLIDIEEGEIHKCSINIMQHGPQVSPPTPITSPSSTTTTSPNRLAFSLHGTLGPVREKEGGGVKKTPFWSPELYLFM